MLFKELKCFFFLHLLDCVILSWSKTFSSNQITKKNLTESECGVPRVTRDITPRIIGGFTALQGEWPWQVALIQVDPNTEKVLSQHCGGTLVNEKWIVTAAHCLVDPFLKFVLPPQFWRVSVDEIQPSNLKVEKYFKLTRIVLHKDFNRKTWTNDIALLKLQDQLEDRRITPICLPKKNFDPFSINKKCFVTGWGRTSAYGPFSKILHKVEVPLISNKECSKIYSATNKFTRNMMCAGERFGGLGPCVGDSGGPIQCLGNNGQWQLIGVTSWGAGCAKRDYPAVFMRINNYLDWIKDHIG